MVRRQYSRCPHGSGYHSRTVLHRRTLGYPAEALTLTFLDPAHDISHRLKPNNAPEGAQWAPSGRPSLMEQEIHADPYTPKVHRPAAGLQPSRRAETRLTGRNGFPARQLISTHMNTGFKRFPPNNFTHFSLSFQSSFHLSLTVLVRYRSLAGI